MGHVKILISLSHALLFKLFRTTLVNHECNQWIKWKLFMNSWNKIFVLRVQTQCLYLTWNLLCPGPGTLTMSRWFSSKIPQALELVLTRPVSLYPYFCTNCQISEHWHRRRKITCEYVETKWLFRNDINL